MVFKPGQSGNPKGRIPGATRAEFIATLKEKGLVAKSIEVMAEALNNPKTRVDAARYILDHVYGKPVQAIGTENNEPIKVEFITPPIGLFSPPKDILNG